MASDTEEKRKSALLREEGVGALERIEMEGRGHRFLLRGRADTWDRCQAGRVGAGKGKGFSKASTSLMQEGGPSTQRTGQSLGKFSELSADPLALLSGSPEYQRLPSRGPRKSRAGTEARAGCG